MPEYYVELAIWVEADNEDDAGRIVADELNTAAALTYEILNVEPISA